MDNKNKPKLDVSKLTPEQRDKLDTWNTGQSQLQTLEDIASMAQEMLGIMDDNQKDPGRKTLIIDHVAGEDFTKILQNMNTTLNVLKGEEAPRGADYTKPVVEAIDKLEKALGSSLKAKDTKAPVVNVPAPQVSVQPTPVDFSGVEKILKTDLPKAFRLAIAAIPAVDIPEQDDTAILDKLTEAIDWLQSIDNASRKRPEPGTMKVTNVDGTKIGANLSIQEAQQTTITSTTNETTIVQAMPKVSFDLYGLILTNTSATATKVTIKDATGGTTRLVFQVPAADTRGFMLPADSAIPQDGNTANWTATCGTSVASLEVTALVNKRS